MTHIGSGLAARLLWGALFAVPLLSGVAHGQSRDHVPVSSVQIKRLGIELVAPIRREAAGIAQLPARIVASRTGGQAVVAPFAGAVTTLHALAGQSVEKGDPIASIYSRDFAESRSALEGARSRLDMAEATLARAKQLHAEGLISGASLAATEGETRQARASHSQHQQFATSSGGVGDRPGAYILRAPAGGRLAAVSVRTGETVSAMQAIAIVVSGDTQWAEIQIPARMIGDVSEGDLVEFGPELTGAILSVGSAIDAETRSTMATAEVPAAAGMRVNQTIRVQILARSAAGASWEIPASAAINIEGRQIVFLADREGFRPVEVSVLGRTGDRLSVAATLPDGAMIASRGLTELKAIILTGSE